MHTGIQLVLCIYGFFVFNSTTGPLRKQRLPYVIISFAILGFFTISYVTDSIVLADLLINGSGDFSDFLTTSPWYVLLGTISNLMVNFIGDGLLVCGFSSLERSILIHELKIYRCYVVWTTHRWVLCFPIVAYIASICESGKEMALRPYSF
jgi:hypothetical protein